MGVNSDKVLKPLQALLGAITGIFSDGLTGSASVRLEDII
jgi:hypothetical protein